MKALCIGGAMIDTIAIVDSERIEPEEELDDQTAPSHKPNPDRTGGVGDP